MPRSSSFCGVILAAGESTRMGRDKALLLWPPGATGGESFLSAAIRSLDPFTEMVIVVVGANESDLAPVIYARGAFLVRNPHPDLGQFSPLRVALKEVLNRGRDAAIITLVDRPPASVTTLQTLTAAFASSTDETWAVVPEFQGKHGHPYLVSREMIEAFLKAPVTGNAREVEHQNQQHIRYVTVDDPAVTLNVNTPEDY